MTEGGEGFSGEPVRTNWETPPKQVNDLSQVPVHKIQDAALQRGVRVEFGAPQPGDTKIPAQVNKVAIKDVPTQPRKFWQFWRWFER